MKKRVVIPVVLIIVITSFLIFLYFYEKTEEKTEYKGKYTIVNETKECDENLVKIGEDHTYIYYLKCADPEKVFLVFENKAKMNLSLALEGKYITLKEVEEKMEDNLFIESIKKDTQIEEEIEE